MSIGRNFPINSAVVVTVRSSSAVVVVFQHTKRRLGEKPNYTIWSFHFLVPYCHLSHHVVVGLIEITNYFYSSSSKKLHTANPIEIGSVVSSYRASFVYVVVVMHFYTGLIIKKNTEVVDFTMWASKSNRPEAKIQIMHVVLGAPALSCYYNCSSCRWNKGANW